MFVLIAFLHPTQCTYFGIPSQFPAAVAKLKGLSKHKLAFEVENRSLTYFNC